MRGVSGILYKNSGPQILAPIGEDLVKMLEAMTHRGRDSSGVAAVGEDPAGGLVIRFWTDRASQAPEVLAGAEETVLRVGGAVRSKATWGQFLRLTINYEGEIPELVEALLNTEGVALHSIGQVSEVIKDVGTPVTMDHKHTVSRLLGTHGIGHVRMATESRVDVNHAHPFLGLPFSARHRGAQRPAHQLPQAEKNVPRPGPPFPDRKRFRAVHGVGRDLAFETGSGLYV